MKKVQLLGINCALLGALCGSAESADVLWDNGPMVTHPAAHPTGSDSSMSQPGSAMGGNVGRFGTGTYYRRADDFSISDPKGWDVHFVRIYLYSTSNLPTDPSGILVWEEMDMNIWNGMPGSGSETLVASSTNATLDTPVFTNIYRVSTGAPESTERPVFAVDVRFDNLTLPANESYWIDYQVKSNSLDGHSAWALVVMDVDDQGNPISQPGNSRQMPIPVFGTEWETWLHAPFNHTFELAFQVHGEVVGGTGVPGDLNNDGVVNVGDMLLMLGAWGACPPGDCPADLDGNGSVGVSDLLIMLSNWG